MFAKQFKMMNRELTRLASVQKQILLAYQKLLDAEKQFYIQYLKAKSAGF